MEILNLLLRLIDLAVTIAFNVILLWGAVIIIRNRKGIDNLLKQLK